MSLAAFLVIGLFSCEDTSRDRDLLFRIDGLENNTLEIESETYAEIKYSTNAPSGYNISFAVDPPDSGLTLNGTDAASNKMTAYATKAAEGDFFNVTATISSNSNSIDIDFVISVINPGGFRITMNGTQGTRFDIDYTKPWPLTYTINPPELQDLVTVTYAIIGTPPNNNLELNNSNASEDPNTVRVTVNPPSNVTYNLRAVATYDGVTINAPFTVRAMPFEALNSITSSNINIAAEGSAPINYRVQPGHHQSSAMVSYTDNSAGKLTIIGNTITAASDATGSYIVTMTVYLPADPENIITGTFTVNIRESTKNYNNRDGQTATEIGSIYDNSATGTGWHVTQIDNLATIAAEDDGEYLNNYIIGVDLGTLLEIEELGAKFYDVDGYEVDVFELLSEYGINYVRLRIWVDPYTKNPITVGGITYPAGSAFGGGTNDDKKVIELAKRAVKWGMKIKLNFHYSDFWCHPGQQPRPRDWPMAGSGGDTDAAAIAVAPVLKQYTIDTIRAMNEAGCPPDIVQVGNENTSGIAGFTNTARQNQMFRAGCEAVREISAELGYPMKIMLHSTDLHQGRVRSFFDARQAANIDYDILGMSFYPMWHGNRDAFRAALRDFTTRYSKEICIAEYSSAYTTLAHPNLEDKSSANANQRTFTGGSTATERTFVGQANLIRNINNDIMNETWHNGLGKRLGIGAFWWEPAWLPVEGHKWAYMPSREWYIWQASSSGGSSADGNQPRLSFTTWANQGFFTYEGTVTPSINAFLQMLGKPIRNYTRD